MDATLYYTAEFDTEYHADLEFYFVSRRQARKREAKAKAQRRANSTGGIRGAPAAAAPADGAAAAVASLTLEDLDYRVRTRLFVIDQLLEPGGHP